MPEKTVNAYQRFILLRLRFVTIGLCLVLLFCLCVSPVGAAELDYSDYVENISTSDGYDLISLKWPISGSWRVGSEYSSGDLYFQNPSYVDFVYYDPFYSVADGRSYLSKTDIPDDTLFTFYFKCDSINVPRDCYLWLYQYDENGHPLTGQTIAIDSLYSDDLEIVTLFNAQPLPFHEDCASFYFFYEFQVNGHYFAGTGDYGYSFYDPYLDVSFQLSSAYRQQQQTNKTNNLLKVVEKKIEENGQTLEEVLQQQQQTNGKLDDMQGSIETLPGQVGDEIQGIIDNEKEQSKGEGNKFVDQILDALPDPSQDVLAALKGLTDATAYTGTDAVLPIPAIVLPGIDGLFPETEIWGGTEFDFGEYIGMLPSALLTLVRSLFTIAIVLFCVYELKGIISYCLTLRENKGG